MPIESEEKPMKTISRRELVAVCLIMAWVAGPTIALGQQTGMSPKTFEQDHKADMRAMKTGQVFVMAGKIEAIDLKYDTVVIACPGNGGTFTVGGPLSAKADLKMGAKAARLSDFQVGAPVTVKWKAAAEGHLILMLKGK
jgi:hypothetical protein